MTKKQVQFTGVNKDILSWKSGTTAALKSQIGMLTTEGKGKLLSQLRGYVDHDNDGSIYRIAFKFPRHGIFIMKGVGRGYVMEDGRVIRAVRKNNAVYTIDGSIERHPKDWFNPVIEKRLPLLAEKIANHYADRAVDQIDHVRVAGINETFKI
jgi:hypothetical protein